MKIKTTDNTKDISKRYAQLGNHQSEVGLWKKSGKDIVPTYARNNELGTKRIPKRSFFVSTAEKEKKEFVESFRIKHQDEQESTAVLSCSGALLAGPGKTDDYTRCRT